MELAFFDSHRFERSIFESQNAAMGNRHRIEFIEARLTPQTVALAEGYQAVCAFVNDVLNVDVIRELSLAGVRLIALRSAGFNNVDLAACRERGIRVTRVPAYSPHAVAEHALALLMTLNRKTHRAYLRVRELNFSLDGLVGFDLHGKTVGVLGTGKIGECFSRIMRGFGCRVLGYDRFPNEALASTGIVEYVDLESLYRASDVVSLHVPLTPETRHIVDGQALALMKEGVIVVNTGRGALIETKALVAALKSGHLGGAALDVYEEEEGIFFYDLSERGLQDDMLARLLTFPNVLITSHQGFLTREALLEIARTTLRNVTEFEDGEKLVNEVV